MNTNTFTFTTREEYKAQVATWKANYAELSATIRAAKLAFKEAERQMQAKYTSATWNAWYDAYKTLNNLRDTARQALEDRAASKIEAQRQYLAAQVQVKEAA